MICDCPSVVISILSSCPAVPVNTITKLNFSNTSSWLIQLLIYLQSLKHVSHLKHCNYIPLPPPSFTLTSSDLMREVTKAIHSNTVADYYIFRSKIAFFKIWAFMTMKTDILTFMIMTPCRMVYMVSSISNLKCYKRNQNIHIADSRSIRRINC
jgi:hypothetical protein